MFQHFRSHGLAFLLFTTLLFLSPGNAKAGWMAFRNDSSKPLIIQEVQLINQNVTLGKPQSLKTGDMVIDTLPCIGSRRFIIQDVKGGVFYNGPIPCAPSNENIIHTLKFDGKGKLQIESEKPNQVQPRSKK
jgi:hypothetical protein